MTEILSTRRWASRKPINEYDNPDVDKYHIGHPVYVEWLDKEVVEWEAKNGRVPPKGTVMWALDFGRVRILNAPFWDRHSRVVRVQVEDEEGWSWPCRVENLTPIPEPKTVTLKITTDDPEGVRRALEAVRGAEVVEP